MRASQYGAPRISTAASIELYSNITGLGLALPCAPAKRIINTTMKPHGFLSLRLTLKALLYVAFVAALAIPSSAANKKAPPPKPASQYAAFDAHAAEKVTIAADPCTDPKQCDFFRLPYIRHGFIPIRVIVTNDGDRALSLDDVRIQFISVNHDVIPAATLEDINRRLFSAKRAMGTKLPVIPVPIHHAPVDKKITDDDSDFGFQGTVVNSHSTLAGYLFYDVRGLDDPPLKGAELYLKMIRTLDGKHELFSFSIPFDKWLAASAAVTPKPSD